jgi:hypothetical protein
MLETEIKVEETAVTPEIKGNLDDSAVEDTMLEPEIKLEEYAVTQEIKGKLDDSEEGTAALDCTSDT